MSEKCEWLAIRVRPKVPRAHRRRVCSANGRRAGAAGHSSQAASTPSSVGFDLVSGRSRRRGVKIGGSLFLRFSASGRLRTATTADEVARYFPYHVLRLSRSAPTPPEAAKPLGRSTDGLLRQPDAARHYARERRYLRQHPKSAKFRIEARG